MTPKEKTKELMQKACALDQHNKTTQSRCKQIALLCVDECIKEHCHESEHKDPLAQDRWIDYWQEVKQEISLL